MAMIRWLMVGYGLTLVMLECCHTLGLPSEFYLLLVRVLYWPIDWLIVNDCCPYWLTELLKLAATR